MAKSSVATQLQLIAEARSHGRTPTALAGAASAIALESARAAFEFGLIEPILVGEPEGVRRAADAIGWDITSVRLVAAPDEPSAAVRAVGLVKSGEARTLMKGHVHTDVLLQAVLNRASGLRTGRRLTHVFLVTLPVTERRFLVTDAAINVRPDFETMLDIVRNAVEVATLIGIPDPRVAILSATEEVTEKVPSTVEADRIARALQPELAGRASLFGPLAMDNAVSQGAAEIKGIDNPVAGRADILVVSNIETGNVLYKAMVHLMGGTAAGVVLGASAPIVLTSRADPPEARLLSVAMAALCARAEASSVGGHGTARVR